LYWHSINLKKISEIEPNTEQTKALATDYAKAWLAKSALSAGKALVNKVRKELQVGVDANRHIPRAEILKLIEEGHHEFKALKYPNLSQAEVSEWVKTLVDLKSIKRKKLLDLDNKDRKRSSEDDDYKSV